MSETPIVDRVIHPVVEEDGYRRVDHPPYIRAANVRKLAKFQVRAWALFGRGEPWSLSA